MIMKKPNQSGGGVNTNLNGMKFEMSTDLSVLIDRIPGYEVEEINFPDKRTVRGFNVKYSGEIIGKLMPTTRFYDFLNDEGLLNTNSKKWEPDEAFINYRNRTIYIVEKKTQAGTGSVDEKLLGFGNKRRLYQRLLDKADNPFSVQFIFMGDGNFFSEQSHKDYFEMMRADGIKIMLDEYDMNFIGLY